MMVLYYRNAGTELYVGDAVKVLKTMAESSVDCVVTSPPHWGLRDYGTATWLGGDPRCRHTLGTTPHQRRTAKKSRTLRESIGSAKRCRKCGAVCCDPQYGLEPTIDAYVERLRVVSAEIARVLAAHGTFWLNLRDSYSYHANGTGRTDTSTAEKPSHVAEGAVTHKSLFGLPWRIAFALQADGWIVRNAIVWNKPNAIPDPALDRLSSRYELLFLLVKQANYHFDIDAIREPY